MTGVETFVIAHAIAAEAKRKREREEEEETVPEHGGSTEVYEYKIIRSASSAFKNPPKFRLILEEESRAGWELFEKLDDARARLRRSVAWRERDAELTQDPYRTKVGLTENIIAMWVVLGILFAVGTVIGIAVLVSK